MAHGYETLTFVHELVSQPEPLLRLLDQPREIMRFACASPSCKGGAPTTPDLSRLATSTASLFGSALGDLAACHALCFHCAHRGQPTRPTFHTPGDPKITITWVHVKQLRPIKGNQSSIKVHLMQLRSS